MSLEEMIQQSIMNIQQMMDQQNSFMAQTGQKIDNLVNTISDCNNHLESIGEHLSHIAEYRAIRQEQDMTFKLISETPPVLHYEEQCMAIGLPNGTTKEVEDDHRSTSKEISEYLPLPPPYIPMAPFPERLYPRKANPESKAQCDLSFCLEEWMKQCKASLLRSEVDPPQREATEDEIIKEFLASLENADDQSYAIKELVEEGEASEDEEDEEKEEDLKNSKEKKSASRTPLGLGLDRDPTREEGPKLTDSTLGLGLDREPNREVPRASLPSPLSTYTPKAPFPQQLARPENDEKLSHTMKMF